MQFSYFGKAYHGWQNQPNAVTVQQVLEEAFHTLVGQPVALTGAGRTDTGVHAQTMFAHFDEGPTFNANNLEFRLNALLPEDIAIQRIFRVADNAHARFDAVARTYEYWVVQEKNPFYLDSAFYLRRVLDVDKMNQAAQLIKNHDDFQCFSKSKSDVANFICKIENAAWSKKGDVLVFTITANRFLRNMVRAIVGTLLNVGTGKTSLNDVKAILNSKDRREAGFSVPAKGLSLTMITYPKTIVQ